MKLDLDELKKGFESGLKEAGFIPSLGTAANIATGGMSGGLMDVGKKVLNAGSGTYNFLSDPAGAIGKSVQSGMDQMGKGLGDAFGKIMPLALPLMAGGLGGKPATTPAGNTLMNPSSVGGMKFAQVKKAAPLAITIPTKMPALGGKMPGAGGKMPLSSQGLGAQNANGAQRFLANGVVKKTAAGILSTLTRGAAGYAAGTAVSQPSTSTETKPTPITSKDPEVEKALENPAVTAYIHKLVSET